MVLFRCNAADVMRCLREGCVEMLLFGKARPLLEISTAYQPQLEQGIYIGSCVHGWYNTVRIFQQCQCKCVALHRWLTLSHCHEA